MVKKIILIHMDLGIGGAEMLMVNIACSMKSLGYDVTILTSHHNPLHCFDETKPPHGILSSCIKVYGDWLPRHIFGYGTAFCAIIRMLYLSIHALTFLPDVDLFFLDGVSAPIPLLQLSTKPIMFYCHFPDKLLCVERGSLLKQWYRLVIDGFEEITTGCADTILVNSKFTAEIFKSSFQVLGKLYTPQVLYPTIDTASIESSQAKDQRNNQEASTSAESLIDYTNGFDFVYVSLNRYERKKNIHLAIEALSVLVHKLECYRKRDENNSDNTAVDSIETENKSILQETILPKLQSEEDFILVEHHIEEVNSQVENQMKDQKSNNNNTNKQESIVSIPQQKIRVLLVIAGGYDQRVDENKEYLQELMKMARGFNIPFHYGGVHSNEKTSDQVHESTGSDLSIEAMIEFRTSISNAERLQLLKRATALLYTPDKEHFGIVPLEAMYAGCPVIAVSSGGPLETIVHNRTGFLCAQTKLAFADAMFAFFANPNIRSEMSQQGHIHVKENFTSRSSEPQLHRYLNELLKDASIPASTETPKLAMRNKYNYQFQLFCSAIIMGLIGLLCGICYKVVSFFLFI